MKIKNVLDNKIHEQAVDGIFVFVGQEPATDFLKDTGLDMKETGQIKVDLATMSTNIKGVFACGDSVVKPVRQVANAVGEGAIAAMMATESKTYSTFPVSVKCLTFIASALNSFLL